MYFLNNSTELEAKHPKMRENNQLQLLKTIKNETPQPNIAQNRKKTNQSTRN